MSEEILRIAEEGTRVTVQKPLIPEDHVRRAIPAAVEMRRRRHESYASGMRHFLLSFPGPLQYIFVSRRGAVQVTGPAELRRYMSATRGALPSGRGLEHGHVLSVSLAYIAGGTTWRNADVPGRTRSPSNLQPVMGCSTGGSFSRTAWPCSGPAASPLAL